MRRLGRQYLSNGGSFKRTREQKKEAQYPVKMLAHVLAPETLQWQGGMTLTERCKDVELR